MKNKVNSLGSFLNVKTAFLATSSLIIGMTAFLHESRSESLTLGDYANQSIEGNSHWIGYWKSVSDVDECLAIDEIETGVEAMGVYGHMAHCISDGDYNKVAGLFLLAHTYKSFDYARVADESAHQAGFILMNYAFNTLEDSYSGEELQAEKEKMASTIDSILKSESKSEICESIREISYPRYYPSYMINHGLGVYKKKHDRKGLLVGFEPEKEWEEILSYNCGV